MIKSRSTRKCLAAAVAWLLVPALCAQPLLACATICRCGERSGHTASAVIDGDHDEGVAQTCCRDRAPIGESNSMVPATNRGQCCAESAETSCPEKSECPCAQARTACSCVECHCAKAADPQDLPPALPLDTGSKTHSTSMFASLSTACSWRANLQAPFACGHSKNLLTGLTAQETCALLSRFQC